MGSRVAHHLLLGRLFVHAMFDEEAEGSCFSHDEWENEEDQERLRDAVEAAASLGLLGGQSDDVRLPLAASSSSGGVTDVLATPPRENIPLNRDASMQKGVAPIGEADTSLRETSLQDNDNLAASSARSEGYSH